MVHPVQQSIIHHENSSLNMSERSRITVLATWNVNRHDVNDVNVKFHEIPYPSISIHIHDVIMMCGAAPGPGGGDRSALHGQDLRRQRGRCCRELSERRHRAAPLHIGDHCAVRLRPVCRDRSWQHFWLSFT